MPGNEGDSTPLKSIKYLLVPTLLCTVAIMQIGVAKFGTLSPWKGGGFGMFAHLDGPQIRTLLVTATDDAAQEYRVLVPFGRFADADDLDSAAQELAETYPTQRRLERIAGAVLNAALVASTEEPGTLPTRLALSPVYEPLISGSYQPLRDLEMLGPERTSDSVGNIRQVVVRAVRFSFDFSTLTVVAQEFGPRGVATVGHDGS